MIIKVFDYFLVLVVDDDSILFIEIVLLIVQDVYLDLDLQVELVVIDVFVVWIKNCIVDGMLVIQCLCLFNQFFYCELGFGLNVNDYYDFENFYLNIVL